MVSGNSRMYATEYAAYYDGAIFRSAFNRSHFFGNFVGKGETVTFNYGFWIDESRKDEIYLFHSFNCMNGVYPDSICEFAIKIENN